MPVTIEHKLVELTKATTIPFAYLDTEKSPNLGRAEFQVCLRFHKGHITEFWVTPAQTWIAERWHYPQASDHGFSIQAYQGLEQPHVWMINWCDMDQAVLVRVYSPDHAKYVRIDSNGLSFFRAIAEDLWHIRHPAKQEQK